MALTATTYATTVQRHIGSANDTIVKSFYASAATSYSAGDLVTIDANGRVVKATTDGQSIDGVVAVDADNSSGAADDIFVSVVVKGNVWVDAFLEASGGTYDDPLTIGGACGASGDGGTTVAEAQALSQTAALSSKQFTSLSIQAIPGAGVIARKALFYFQGSGKFE